MSLVYQHLLKKISPIWYEYLERYERKHPHLTNFNNFGEEGRFFHKNQYYDISNSRCCIVGEAHDFEFGSEYNGCGKCYDFSLSLFKVHNWKQFWEDRQMFAEHFIEEHSK